MNHSGFGPPWLVEGETGCQGKSSLYLRAISDTFKTMFNLDKNRKFYFLGIFLIIAATAAIILHSLPDKESIAMAEKGRVRGISKQKIILPLAIIIKDNKNEWRGVSELTDTKDIIKSLQVPLYPEDLFSAFPDPRLQIGTTITINRAPVIYLQDGLQSIELRSWSKNVSDLFKEKNIILGPLDNLSVSFESLIKDKDTLTITRVGERDETIEEVIAYQKIEKSTSDLYKGESKLQQKGSAGKKLKIFRLRYENNALVSRTLINEEIAVPAQTEITLIGIKPRVTVRCRFNDIVEEASAKYGLDPNALCRTMMCESNGNPNSDGGNYKGLFQYTFGLWTDISPRAGFPGASIWDARAQIYVTAWAWSHGYRGRWPSC